jgi:hypothetical protein
MNIEKEISLKDTDSQAESMGVGVPPEVMLGKHQGFEVVSLPNGALAKFAYERLFGSDLPDEEIELSMIALYEDELQKIKDLGGYRTEKKIKEYDACKEKIKFHYRQAISILCVEEAAGWNRWSEDVLSLFVDENLHKIIWGSGNCGKSVIMAVLLYVKWRVRPGKRMVVIATKVLTDATARVFGYIKKIHVQAPEIRGHKIELIDNAKERGIFCLMWDKKKDGWVRDARAAIISLPVKVNASQGEIGSNLLGKHPQDRLIIAFDEAQELPASMSGDKIFLNWYTNKKLDIYAWGNPQPIDYYSPDSYDMLYKLGSDKLRLPEIKELEKGAEKTGWWQMGTDTRVLHLTMMDSPKDDANESGYKVRNDTGILEHRLHFLAGSDAIKRISEHTEKNTAAWYSQVLGFPFINMTNSNYETVWDSAMVKVAAAYPLDFRTPEDKLIWFMGVDPSITGRGDSASIVCGRMGMMKDGRIGVDLVGGKACVDVEVKEGENFTDSIVETMWVLSQRYGIRLDRIGVETHAAGEVLRYAMLKHYESGKWAKDRALGRSYITMSPMIAATERDLFKNNMKLQPAHEICADITTERWVACKCAMSTRQLFNVPETICRDFYNRYLFKAGSNKTFGAKYKIENKRELIKRGVKSPNKGDAFSFMFDAIRLHGFNYKFSKTASYNPIYGAKYDLEMAHKKAAERVGRVSAMLGLGDALGKTGNKRMRTLGDIDSV